MPGVFSAKRKGTKPLDLRYPLGIQIDAPVILTYKSLDLLHDAHFGAVLLVQDGDTTARRNFQSLPAEDWAWASSNAFGNNLKR